MDFSQVLKFVVLKLKSPHVSRLALHGMIGANAFTQRSILSKKKTNTNCFKYEALLSGLEVFYTSIERVETDENKFV